MKSGQGSCKRIRILVCTANLGNAQPDNDSVAAWIPQDGVCNEVIKENPIYPLLVISKESPLSMPMTSNLMGDDPDTADQSSSSESDDEDQKHCEDPKLASKGQLSPGRGSENAPRLSKEKVVKVARALAAWAKVVNQRVSGRQIGRMEFEERDNSVELAESHELVVDEKDRFEIIVIGMQEATFDPRKLKATESGQLDTPKSKSTENGLFGTPKSKSTENGQLDNANDDNEDEDSVESTNPIVEPLKKGARRLGKGVQQIARLTQDRDYTKQQSGTGRDWSGGAEALHEQLDARLPSYHREVSYQRGQMRLEVYCHSKDVRVEVLHVCAHNTGRVGLANKGGIVAELLVNGTTRLSFVTVHLEAHEGHSKYRMRCSSMVEIFENTKNSRWHDVSHTSHHSFTLGDLNFRTELDSRLPKDSHRRAIQAMVDKENWLGINKLDELHRALKQKMCLVGYRTPICNFPPTFKTERQVGFKWQEKRRPSYCSRVLFKSANGLDHHLRPLVYEPIPSFRTSDHKPMRAAFSIDLNNPLLPWNVPTPSRRFLLVRGQSTMQPELSVNKIHTFLSDLSVDIFDKDGMAPNPYVALISTPKEALEIKVSQWKAFPFFKRKKTKPNLKPARWPTTSRKFGTFSPDWRGEELSFDIKLRHPDRTSIDLTGAMLHFTVFDFNPLKVGEDSVIGTFTYNLVPLLVKSREHATSQQQSQESRFRRSKMSLISSDTDMIDSFEIKEALTKNGKEVGRITCTLESWVRDADFTKMGSLSARFTAKKRSPRAHRRTNLVGRTTEL